MSTALLSDLRVVDLAGEPAEMTGRILADLGADVVKVELPEGDPLRAATPLSPVGASLRFVAWSAGKSQLRAKGPDDPRLLRLLETADVVITTPGWPGAPCPDRCAAPGSVWAEVTPFGTTGPRSAWKASDLGVMASSGNMYCTGDPDRPPVRCTEPTAWAHVGPETAVAILTALASGRAQRVDVSIQESVMIASMGHPARFPRTKMRGRRSGANVGVTREIWRCRDGFVSFGLRGGKARVANLQTITRLVTEDGLATPALTERDWAAYDHNKLSAGELEEISAPIAAYLGRHGMSELYEIACDTNLMLAPANSPRELIESRQLAERGFFTHFEGIEHFPKTFLHVTSPGDGVEQPGPRAGTNADPSDWIASSGRGVKPARPPGVWTRSAGRASLRAETHSSGHGGAANTHASGPGGAADAHAHAHGGAWEGTHLLEFGTGAAGPIAVRYFAENGATVIRIESRTRPDFLRTYGMRPDNPCGLEGSDMFDSVNVGKLGLTLNLKHPQGVALAKRLIAWADAVAENFAPRAMRGFGLDYASLSADKPDLVMVSSCLQGQTGPHRDYPGFGGQGSALGGYNLLTGWPDREPVGPFGTITDSLAPRFVATALAAGLLYRRRTGNGVHLDVSQVESAVYSLTPWVLDYVVNGHTGTRQGNRSDRFSPHGVFPCAGEDRFVAIACWDDWDWSALAARMGLDAETTERFATLEQRKAAEDELEQITARWTAVQSAVDVARQLQQVGLEAVPVADLGDVWEDEQLRHRGHFVTLDHPCMGECAYERNGFRLSDAEAGYVRTSPLLGEHNDHVLGEILGIGSSEQERLRQDGVFD